MNDTDPDKPSIIDRARGALLGLAVGDALGSSLEFGPRVASPMARRDMVGGGPFNLQPGQCGFRLKPATDSEMKPAGVPI